MAHAFAIAQRYANDRGFAERLGYQREMGDGSLAYDENASQSIKDMIFRKTGSYGATALKDGQV